MASPQLVGFALIFAFFAMLWISGHLRPGAISTDGTRIEDPWSSPNWCASTGSGSNDAEEDDPDRPRNRPLVIEDIARRRFKILIWLENFGVPERDREDVAQEIIHGAWKSSPNYDPDRARIDTWLYRITFHWATAYHKSAYTRRAEVFDPDLGPWQEVVDPDDPEALVAELEDIEDAQAIINRLPSHLAAAYVAVDVREIDAVSYARKRGMSKSTVQGWVRQARKALALEVRREFADPVGAAGAPDDELGPRRVTLFEGGRMIAAIPQRMVFAGWLR